MDDNVNIEEDIENIILDVESLPIKRSYFANIIGIHHYSFNKKLRDKNFRIPEIKVLKEKLKDLKRVLLV